MLRHLAVLSALAMLVPFAVRAAPDIPPAQARLIVGGPMGDGRYEAGLVVTLPQGWHTYWRTPGDSGVPPTFDTAGSENLAALDVAYPVPKRYFDGFGTSIVYEGEVVLPLRLTAADPAAPIRVAIRFDYGYCKEICVPASASLEADLDPARAEAPADRARIAEARAAVPVPAASAGPGAPRIGDLTPVPAGKRGSLDVTVLSPADAEAPDLFVEGPEGWYLSPPEFVERTGDRAVFRLSLDGMPRKATLSGTPLRFTIVSGGKGVEDVRNAP